MKRHRVLLVAVTLLALAAAGCGGGGADTSSSSSSGTSAPAAAGGDGVVELTVEMGTFFFRPDPIEVPEGSTVRLVLENVDPALVHDFVIEDLDIDSGKVAAGEKTIVEFVAERAGSFRIICTEPGHEAGGMVGTFTVN